MIKKLQKKYALSEQGAKDLVKGCLACVLQNLSFMFPVGLLYFLVADLMNGGVPGEKIIFYIIGCVVCIGLILLTTYFQYNATYFATYTESGVRRITLAERLRKIPLSFFGKKDLADLTSTIMADCTFLEQSFSHFIPELAGSIISTVLISISLLVFDWRMALAALWVGGQTVWRMRALAAVVLAVWWGFNGVCLANPLAWLGAALPLGIAYYASMRRLKREGLPPPEAV